MKMLFKAPISHGFPAIKAKHRQSRLMVIDTVASTNTWCKDNISNLNNGDIITTLKQTKGRGRFKRKWFSAVNASIIMSTVIDGSLYKNPACIGQSAAIAVAGFLKELGLRPQLKWPNDVMVRGRKISGILLETAGHGMIVLGIGINISTSRTAFRKNGLAAIATSVKAESGMQLDCMMLLPLLILRLGKELQLYRKKGLKHISTSWTKNDFLKGKHIKVSQPGKTMTGKYIGLSTDGFLLLKTDAGRTEELTSGDISVQLSKA